MSLLTKKDLQMHTKECEYVNITDGKVGTVIGSTSRTIRVFIEKDNVVVSFWKKSGRCTSRKSYQNLSIVFDADNIGAKKVVIDFVIELNGGLHGLVVAHTTKTVKVFIAETGIVRSFWKNSGNNTNRDERDTLEIINVLRCS